MSKAACLRMKCIGLTFVFLCLLFPGTARAEARVFLSCDAASTLVPTGETLHFTLTGEEVQAMKLMAVTPDSRQEFIEGDACDYTLLQPGLYVFIGYGLAAGSNDLCMSGMLYITAMGNGNDSAPASEQNAAPAEDGESALSESISNLDSFTSLFDQAAKTAIEGGNDPIHSFAAALYRGANITGTAWELISSGSEERQQIDFTKSLIMENFQDYLVDQETDLYAQAMEAVNGVNNLAAFAEDANLFSPVKIPIGGGDYIEVWKSFTGYYNGAFPAHQVDDDAIKVAFNGVHMICDSMEDVQRILAMHYAYSSAMRYLTHIMDYAGKDSFLYRACEELAADANERWPFGALSRELALAGAKATGVFFSYHLGKFVKLVYETEGAALAPFTRGVDLALHQYHLVQGPFTLSHLEKLNALQKTAGEACGVLLAWEAGAVIGRLLTHSTNTAIQEEQKLLRLYIADNEIKNAMRGAKSNGAALFDLTSLYLTTQETGICVGKNYFDALGRTAGLAIRSVFTGESYPYGSVAHIANSEIRQINAVRAEMGLPASDTRLTEPQTIIDFTEQNYIDPGPGDHF